MFWTKIKEKKNKYFTSMSSFEMVLIVQMGNMGLNIVLLGAK